MKSIFKFICAAILAVTIATPIALRAGDSPEAKPKPYPLNTCIVTGEKLDADPAMTPYTFVHEGQEIKLCCKSCKKKFDKDPATYLKKLKDAPAKK